eukprot:1119985-Prorocentrum_minimum.AAC.1
MPSSIPSKAADLIKKLLVQDPKKRLGADAKGIKAVKGAPRQNDGRRAACGVRRSTELSIALRRSRGSIGGLGAPRESRASLTPNLLPPGTTWRQRGDQPAADLEELVAGRVGMQRTLGSKRRIGARWP